MGYVSVHHEDRVHPATTQVGCTLRGVAAPHKYHGLGNNAGSTRFTEKPSMTIGNVNKAETSASCVKMCAHKCW